MEADGVEEYRLVANLLLGWALFGILCGFGSFAAAEYLAEAKNILICLKSKSFRQIHVNMENFRCDSKI